ncbi:MAG: DUF1499 domain-containing protein [Gammaproteobacteria bacterium]|nr:DUF1499 domain-containing protein [Gammaproteobacteria bacterium]
MSRQPEGTRLSRIGCWSAAIGLLLIAASAGHRLGFLASWQIAFGALALAGLSMLTALITSGLGLLRSRGSAGNASRAATWLAFFVALAITGFNASRLATMGGPPIHDITTDINDPPAFVAAIPLREAAGATNPSMYFPDESAALQAEAYPDISTIVLDTPAPAAFESAKNAARAMGWEIIATVPEEGRIEATATTPWIGFKDDVVIRVAASGLQSQVDVRSKSRVGKGDAGLNAKRIRAFRDRLTSG